MAVRRRLIPCLLLQGESLVKTRCFGEPKYVGDPINVVRIFNEKGVDEIVLLDTQASVFGRPPQFDLIERIASECFMPLAYGGGVVSVGDIKRLQRLGVEKVIVNSAAYESVSFIEQAASVCGSQAIVGAIDVVEGVRGEYFAFSHSGTRRQAVSVREQVARLEGAGVGELFVNSITRDGRQQGYDTRLINAIGQAVSVPVIACGGAGSLDDVRHLFKVTRVSAAAAGSLFVLKGPHRAVLVSYPKEVEFIL